MEAPKYWSVTNLYDDEVEYNLPPNCYIAYGDWVHPMYIPDGSVYEWREIGSVETNGRFFLARSMKRSDFGDIEARMVHIVENAKPDPFAAFKKEVSDALHDHFGDQVYYLAHGHLSKYLIPDQKMALYKSILEVFPYSTVALDQAEKMLSILKEQGYELTQTGDNV